MSTLGKKTTIREIEMDLLLNKIKKSWRLVPEWRLGQFLVNLMGSDLDLFYVDDRYIFNNLERLEVVYAKEINLRGGSKTGKRRSTKAVR